MKSNVKLIIEDGIDFANSEDMIQLKHFFMIVFLLGFLTQPHFLYADFQVSSNISNNGFEDFKDNQGEVQTEECCNVVYDFYDHFDYYEDICDPNETTDFDEDGYIYDECWCDELLNSIVDECSDPFVEIDYFSEEEADSYSQAIEEGEGLAALDVDFHYDLYFTVTMCTTWEMLNLQEEAAEQGDDFVGVTNIMQNRESMSQSIIRNYRP